MPSPVRICLARFGVEATSKPVLGPVCLVTDDHDVLAIAQRGELVLTIFGAELLDGGEDDSTAGSISEQIP